MHMLQHLSPAVEQKDNDNVKTLFITDFFSLLTIAFKSSFRCGELLASTIRLVLKFFSNGNMIQIDLEQQFDDDDAMLCFTQNTCVYR